MSLSHSTIKLGTLLRAPAALRPLLIQQAAYHSYDRPNHPPYSEVEARILSNALQHVSAHGFTQEALSLGTRDANYLAISMNLFPKGAFDLVKYHLVSQRLSLAERVQFPNADGTTLGIGQKVRSIILARLRGNVEAGVVSQWQEALGLMSLAENIPASLKELAALSDEVWFLAGDKSVNGSWYTKRASLAGVYAATEVFQTTDQSTDFRDTEAFLDRRLDEVRVVGGTVGGVMEWAGFQAGAMVNLLRSKGVRI